MPFTPSHAVVALPFVRTPLVPGAIAVGAMTPDLPLFLRGVGVDYAFTHSYPNIGWTALLSFGFFLLWRTVLRPAAGELLPTRLVRRLPAEWSDEPGLALRRAAGIGSSRWYPVLLAVSFVVGVLSHIAWDSFTHEGRWGVVSVPVLNESWGPLLGYKWLQYGSSVLGIAVLGLVAVVWLRRSEPREIGMRVLPAWLRVAWWLSLPIVLLVAWLGGLALHGPLSEEFTVQHLAYRVLPPACGAWAVTAFIGCLVLLVRRRNYQRG